MKLFKFTDCVYKIFSIFWTAVKWRGYIYDVWCKQIAVVLKTHFHMKSQIDHTFFREIDFTKKCITTTLWYRWSGTRSFGWMTISWSGSFPWRFWSFFRRRRWRSGYYFSDNSSFRSGNGSVIWWGDFFVQSWNINPSLLNFAHKQKKYTTKINQFFFIWNHHHIFFRKIKITNLISRKKCITDFCIEFDSLTRLSARFKMKKKGKLFLKTHTQHNNHGVDADRHKL